MLRLVVAAFIGTAAGIFGYVGALALLRVWWAAGLIAVLVAGFAGWWVQARSSAHLDFSGVSRSLRIASGLAGAVVLVQLFRIAVFMVDPSHVGYSFYPSSRWEIEHSCATAYFVAAEASGSSNIYDPALYSLPGDPSKPRSARSIGPFNVDVFEYPPQFLLLPQALRPLAPTFEPFRQLWFAMNGLVLLIALWAVARMTGPVIGTRALLCSPFVWLSLPILGTLQKGNFQIIAIAASMLAMVLFERRRFLAGGALLAFTTVSKLFPGLLVVYLLACRQWRPVAWTVAFVGIYSVATLGLWGWGAYAAFLDHLPGLLGGEAFPAFRRPPAIAANYSIPGLVFKLDLFGIDGGGFAAAKVVGWIYTLVLLAATLYAARRAWRDHEKPMVWLAILVLATLRSPFLPQVYGGLPALWLLTLWAANRATTSPRMLFALVMWAVLNTYWPIDKPIDPRWLALLTMLPQALVMGLAVVSLRPATEAMERSRSAVGAVVPAGAGDG